MKWQGNQRENKETMRKALVATCVLFLLVAIIPVVGCGGGDKNSPTEAVNNFFDALNEKNFDAYKSLLVEEDRKRVEKYPFEAEEDFEVLSTGPYEYNVVKEEIEGDKATVVLIMQGIPSGEETGEVNLVKEKGEWKVDW